MTIAKWKLQTLRPAQLEEWERGPAVHLLESGPRDPLAWLAERAANLFSQVSRRGAAIIRGLGLRGPQGLAEAVSALGLPIIEHYGDLPYQAVDANVRSVFTTTPYPADHAILFHNEGAHTNSPPRLLVFQCDQPAAEGGETPLADSCEVWDQLPPASQNKFRERGLLYVRKFVPGLDVPWQRFFGSADPRVVDKICAAAESEAEWDRHAGLVVRTRRPAVQRHPSSGREAFLNQVLLHHPAALEGETGEDLRRSVGEANLPRNVLFGDGSPIPDPMVEEILEAHLRVAVCFRWEAGDLAVLDNWAYAHARRPYLGPRTHHVVLSGLGPPPACTEEP